MNRRNSFWKLMEGNAGRLSLSSTDEDSPYDTPRSTENSLSPTGPPKTERCSHCGDSCPDLCAFPCQHSLCAACLSSKPHLCPECPLTNVGLIGLLPDNGSTNFLQSINQKRNQLCTNCKNDSPEAVGKCLDCESFLCVNCMITHCLSFSAPGSSTHKVIDIYKNNDVRYETNNEDAVIYCSHHPSESVKWFCYSCNISICQACFDETHLDANHLIEDINIIKRDVISHLFDKLKESKEHAAEFDLVIKCNNQTLWSLHNQYSDIVSKIHHAYEHHHAQLLKYKEQQLAVLETAYNRMLSSVRTNTKLSEDAINHLNRLNDFCSRLFICGNSAQFLMYKRELETEISNYCSVKAKPLHCNLRYESDDTDISNNLTKTFGRVIYEMNGLNSENHLPVLHYVPKVDLPAYPFRYEKWSNSGLDELKNFSELSLCDDSNLINRPFHIKSNVVRQTITYNWKFGAYGSVQGQFTEPNGVCINSEGDIIIADTNNNRVQVFDRSGKFKFCFGDGNNGDSGTLLFPNRVAVMEKSGDIVVTERAPTHQVQIYNQYGQFIRKFGATVLQHPRAVTVDKDGFIIVVECKVMRIIIFDQMGTIKHKISCSDSLQFPNGVAVNEKQEIFISDNRCHCVVVYNYLGNKLRTIGHEGLTNYPIGVMLNKAGQVIVADNHNNFNLTVFTEEGQFVAAVESKVKHAQCYDAAISSDGVVALTSKDYRVYVYMTSF